MKGGEWACTEEGREGGGVRGEDSHQMGVD